MYYLSELFCCDLSFLEKPYGVSLVLKIQREQDGERRRGRVAHGRPVLSISQFCSELAVFSLSILGLYQLILNLPRVILHIENFRVIYE